MAAVLIVAAVLIILVIIFELFTRSSRNGALNLPPGSYGWPVLGETAEFLRAGLDGKPEKFVRERMEKYNSQVFKTWIMGEPMAVLCGAAGNKFLFSNENKLVTVWWPSSVRKLLGPCLATSGGEEGRQMRRMVSYFVSPDAFTRLYIKTMDMVSQQHIKTHWQGKEEVKVFPTIKQYTFELACRLFMSLEDGEQIGKLAILFNIFLKGIISIPINLPGARFYRAKKATYAIKNELHKLVRERRGALEQKTALPCQDLLSHLLVTPDENARFMAEPVIVNNILMLLFAGHDTSSVAITMLLKSLAERPDVYEKVLREQREIATEGAGEFLQWEDIQKMKYSWSVVCEAMRLSPPVIGAFREALTDISYAGYHIPKGWKLYWSSSNTHRDPSLFKSYTEFDPSRFEESSSGPAPYSYVPFGGGPRMCLGKEFARLEILIFLHNLIKRYRWKLVNPREKIAYDPMPTPVEGLPILLQPHI
uniref:Cytochrome P450 CYP716D25 n=1 Tax=Salvia miltiorrhiza TaxID=226208 RepID=A0A0B4VSX6_SALMI|nr:cytochrome P450 CYP716D25 [Salvia miltiorrhiza]